MDKIKETTNVRQGRYWFYFFLIVVIGIKFFFFYTVTVIPQAVFEPDSSVYLQAADSIRDFFLHPQHGLTHNSYPMPGYPLILAFCLYGLGLSIHQMAFIQILLNFLTAFVVARIARSINPNWAALSALIVLLDLPFCDDWSDGMDRDCPVSHRNVAVDRGYCCGGMV
jgi:hypothetical protein